MNPLLPFCVLVVAHLSVSAQIPSSIEAVEYDPAGRWLVSNGSSILSTDDAGATWTTFGSVGASHGMEVVDGHLFALHNGVLRAVDLVSESQTSTLNIPGTSFLNGMGSRSGELVISDFGTGALHRVDISDPANMASTVLVSDLGATPNGVVIDEANNRALVVTWGACSIYAVDLETAAVSTVVASTGLNNCDGIDLDGSGRAYVSSWSPNRITRFTADFASSEAVVTSGLSSPADISYAIDLDTLAVANSGSDVVTFHGFAPAVGMGQVASKQSPEFAVTAEGMRVRGAAAGLWYVTGWNLQGQQLWTQACALHGGEQAVHLPPAGSIVTWLSPQGAPWTIKRGPRLP
jgi:hypothetical protein